MPNIVRYDNQVWGSPITGERLSTNGYYTGQHKGTVLQDNAVEGTEEPYGVELGTLRYGTMLRDATPNSMPTKQVNVTQKLVGCTSNKVDGGYTPTADFSATYTASDGYTMTGATAVVKIDGQTATASTDYTFTGGVLTIDDEKLTGNVDITITAAES